MTLQEIISNACTKLIESGDLEKAIEERVAKTFAKVLDDSMGPYSDFSKGVTDAIKRSVAIGEHLDIPSYNEMIIGITRRMVQGAMEGAVQKQVQSRLEELLEPLPESIKLSKLIESYLQKVKEENEGNCVCYGDHSAITAILERDEGSYRSGDDWWILSLDDEPDKKQRECEIRIHLHGGKVWHLAFRDRCSSDQLFKGPSFGFEKQLFQMKACGTRIEIDCDPSDLDLTVSGEYD